MPIPPCTDSTRNKPEILAPAGGRAQLEAAVASGADAVYFGLDSGLNARVRAASFAVEHLPETLDYLHERGVRGYLTLNTLVFDEELERAESLVHAAAHAGVDALIVQDIGLLRLARAVAPGLPLHASTQMSVTDAAGVEFAAALGVRRVVIGRELSIDEIAAITASTSVEIEAFVHGALCVSYSGQCFSSEAWGGRSANRGQCAQACRLPYGLLVDGELREQGDQRYLLSPQDLMALEQLPRLVRAGVRSVKIEGRLKGPEYVQATVHAYRGMLDRVWADLQAGRASDSTPSQAQRRQLAQLFSRGQDADADGLTPGFLEGPRHQELVIGRNPRHRGLYLGKVAATDTRGITVQLGGPVRRGDGLVFDRGRPEDSEVGGNVYQVSDRNGHPIDDEIDQGLVTLRFASDFDWRRVGIGDRVWRTREAPRAMTGRPGDTPAGVPVTLRVEGSAGAPLRLLLSDADGHQVQAETSAVLQPATGQPLDADKLGKAIGTLGDTPFRITELVIQPTLIADALFIPPGQIKHARRDVVDALRRARRQHARAFAIASAPCLPQLLPAAEPPTAVKRGELSLLCRTRAQVDAALADGAPDEIVVDFLEVHGLKEACAAVRGAGQHLVVAAPRVFKPGEARLWHYLCRLAPDALLVRSAGLLWQLRARGGTTGRLDDGTPIPALFGDFSLNAANVPAAMHLLDMGLQRLTPTHDLNGAQIAALARGLPAEQRARIEVIAHQHLPIFHTEHCVFARFLSSGNSYRDCGRPCESHVVHLRDRGGADHLLQADIGCRNTVFNAAAQSAGALLHELQAAGITHYRIELVDEPPAEVGAIVAAYRKVLDGQLPAEDLLRRLGRVRDANGRPQGVGPGSLEVSVEPPRAALKRPTARRPTGKASGLPHPAADQHCADMVGGVTAHKCAPSVAIRPCGCDDAANRT